MNKRIKKSLKNPFNWVILSILDNNSYVKKIAIKRNFKNDKITLLANEFNEYDNCSKDTEYSIFSLNNSCYINIFGFGKYLVKDYSVTKSNPESYIRDFNYNINTAVKKIFLSKDNELEYQKNLYESKLKDEIFKENSDRIDLLENTLNDLINVQVKKKNKDTDYLSYDMEFMLQVLFEYFDSKGYKYDKNEFMEYYYKSNIKRCDALTNESIITYQEAFLAHICLGLKIYSEFSKFNEYLEKNNISSSFSWIKENKNESYMIPNVKKEIENGISKYCDNVGISYMIDTIDPDLKEITKSM